MGRLIAITLWRSKMIKKVITYKGEKYAWKCYYADGSYYENENGFVLTDRKGEVDFDSCNMLEMQNKK